MRHILAETGKTASNFTNGSVGTLNVQGGFCWDRIEQFSDNYATDNINGAVGSLVLEAMIPAGSGGKTLTISQFSNSPYYGGRRPGGRFLMVSDIKGTLSPSNPLTVRDDKGRQFYVGGQAASSTFVLDKPYQSKFSN